MSRALVRTFVGLLLLTIAGQGVLLRSVDHPAVTRVELHESRLVLFLQEIRRESPLVYDSALLNLTRIRDDDSEQRFRPEERVVAGALIARLTGAD